MFNINIMELPHVRLTASGNARANQPLTSENVAAVIEKAGLTLRYNIMLHRFELHGDGYADTEIDQGRALMELEDTFKMLDISVTGLGDILMQLGRQGGAYHPMEDWILSGAWDGKSRLADLAKSVPTDSAVWPEYLRKWLIQIVEAVRGWRSGELRSLPFVLVFVGGQGAGKGRWLRSLAPGYVLADAELHLNGHGAKDQQINALRFPVVELGEIDSTFKKSEISALKSFLSRQVDSLRAPYARLAVDRPRMSIFAGSVNSPKFLNDPTGARRFWPIELRDGESMAWGHGVDMQQVFAEANVMWDADGEDWNLEAEAEAAREAEMSAFVQVNTSVELVAAHRAKYRDDYDNYGVLNTSQICRLVGAGRHPADVAAVGEWLRQNLGKARKLKGVQNAWAFPVGITGGDLGISRVNLLDAKNYVMGQCT